MSDNLLVLMAVLNKDMANGLSLGMVERGMAIWGFCKQKMLKLNFFVEDTKVNKKRKVSYLRRLLIMSNFTL